MVELLMIDGGDLYHKNLSKSVVVISDIYLSEGLTRNGRMVAVSTTMSVWQSTVVHSMKD